MLKNNMESKQWLNFFTVYETFRSSAKFGPPEGGVCKNTSKIDLFWTPVRNVT